MIVTVDFPDDIADDLDALARRYGSRDAALTELVRGAVEGLTEEPSIDDESVEKQLADLEEFFRQIDKLAKPCPYPVDDCRERIYEDD